MYIASRVPRVRQLKSFPENCLPCQSAIAGHGDPSNSSRVVNVGAEGLDQPGDSLFFFHGKQISATVSNIGNDRMSIVNIHKGFVAHVVSCSLILLDQCRSTTEKRKEGPPHVPQP